MTMNEPRLEQRQTELSQLSGCTRRQFMEVTVGAAILTGLSSAANAAQGKAEVPRGTVGRTGEKASMVGIGGFHLGKPELAERAQTRAQILIATRIVPWATSA